MNADAKLLLFSIITFWLVLFFIAAAGDPAGEVLAEPVTMTCLETEQPEPTTEAETEAATEAEPQQLDPVEVELIGRTIWGEAEGVQSTAERAAVAWCILNRVDVYGASVEAIVTAPQQFKGYRPAGECPQAHLDLAADVLARWYAEKDGSKDVGRVLPAEYLYFVGDGDRNHFSIEWQSSTYWGWSLPDPYIINPAD